MELINIHWWGMHTFWWIFWIFILAMIFFSPWGSSKRSSKSSLLYTLRKTYAEGKISTQEFEERKKVLEKEFQRNLKQGAATTDKSENS